MEPAVAGTSGTETEPPRDGTPGGHSPQPQPSDTADEIEHRAGDALTELGTLVEGRGHGHVGRRIEVQGVEVERVESPSLFWARSGDARVAVVAARGAAVERGHVVNIIGSVERSGDTVRIRAFRVTPAERQKGNGPQ